MNTGGGRSPTTSLRASSPAACTTDVNALRAVSAHAQPAPASPPGKLASPPIVVLAGTHTISPKITALLLAVQANTRDEEPRCSVPFGGGAGSINWTAQEPLSSNLERRLLYHIGLV